MALETVIYPTGSAELASGYTTATVGSPQITFAIGQSGKAPGGYTYHATAFSITDSGRTIDIPDNVGNPRGWILQKGYKEGSATLTWPSAANERPCVGWEFSYSDYIGNTLTAETYVVTSVSESRSAGALRSVSINWRRKTV